MHGSKAAHEQGTADGLSDATCARPSLEKGGLEAPVPILFSEEFVLIKKQIMFLEQGGSTMDRCVKAVLYEIVRPVTGRISRRLIASSSRPSASIQPLPAEGRSIDGRIAPVPGQKLIFPAILMQAGACGRECFCGSRPWRLIANSFVHCSRMYEVNWIKLRKNPIFLGR